MSYQPNIIELSDIIIDDLKDTGFFEDYNITDYSFSKELFCEKLTEKYLKSDDFMEDSFTEDEFDAILRTIITNNLVNELKNKGLVDTIEDENGEEVVFLTDKGKELKTNLQENGEL